MYILRVTVHVVLKYMVAARKLYNTCTLDTFVLNYFLLIIVLRINIAVMLFTWKQEIQPLKL